VIAVGIICLMVGAIFGYTACAMLTVASDADDAMEQALQQDKQIPGKNRTVP